MNIFKSIRVIAASTAAALREALAPYARTATVEAEYGDSVVEGSVLTQAIGAGAVMLYSLVLTALLLWLTKLIVGLRVDEQSELTGLDIAQYRERIGS